MAMIVQKYGGTSVGNSERIRNVAQRVAKFQAQGHQVVVVVSAMSGETNRLIALAKEVQTSDTRTALAVQKTAILEDGGASVAFIQKGGESWVRRVVTTGAIDGPWIEVLSGLNEGERVATSGAYKIKLASGSIGEVGHGHAH